MTGTTAWVGGREQQGPPIVIPMHDQGIHSINSLNVNAKGQRQKKCMNISGCGGGTCALLAF